MAAAKNTFWGKVQAAQRVAVLKGARFPDDTPAKRLRRRAEALVFPERFNATYLPHYFRDEASPFHQLLYLALAWERQVVVRAPRGHAKTTVLSFAYPLRQVACAGVLRAWEQGTLKDQDPALYQEILRVWAEHQAQRRAAGPRSVASLGLPEHWDLTVDVQMDVWLEKVHQLELKATVPPLRWDPYIQMIGADGSTALEFSSAIRADLEGNDLLLGDWGELAPCYAGDWGRRVRRAASDSDWESNGTRLRAYGMDEDIRGGKHGPWRPTLVIADDPDSERTTRTKNQRDENTRKLMGAVKFGLEPGKGRVLFAGTPHHPDCIVVRLSTHEQFAKSWASLRFRALDEKGRALFPARWSAEALQQQQEETEPEVFEAEMGDRPPAIGGRPFHTLHYYDRAQFAEVALPKVLIFDPAGGQNSKSDYQAIVVLRGPTAEGWLLVHRVEFLRIGDPLELVVHVKQVADEEAADLNIAEAIGLGLVYAALLGSASAAAESLMGWERIERQTEAKDLRIRSLAPLVNVGVLRFPNDKSCRPLERQALDYGEAGAKKDGLDACEMGVRRMRASTQFGQVRHGRRRHGSPFRVGGVGDEHPIRGMRRFA